MVNFKRDSTKTLAYNGQSLHEDKGMNFKEVIDILDRQMVKDTQHPWAKESSPLNISMQEWIEQK